MKKSVDISDQDIYVSSERKHSDKESGEYLYNLWYYGNIEVCSFTADDARQIIACLQNALKANEEGGAK